QVRRVTFAFESLQVVAVLDRLRDIEMILRECHPFVIWQKRHAFLGAHVGKDDAPSFSARVGGVANLLVERAAARLRRSFQNSAVDVVLPAMVDATQAAFFVAAKKQGGASVRTVLSQKPHTAHAIAKGDEIFTEKSQSYRCALWLADFFREKSR